MNSETYKKWQVHFYTLIGWSIYIFCSRKSIDIDKDVLEMWKF